MEYEQDEFDFLNMILKDLLTNFCHCCIETICNEALKSIYILKIKPEKMVECYLRFLKEKIINIEIECKNKIYGCQERIRYGELHYHLQECKYANKNNLKEGHAKLKSIKKSPNSTDSYTNGTMETGDDGHYFINTGHKKEMVTNVIQDQISLDEELNNLKIKNRGKLEIEANHKSEINTDKKDQKTYPSGQNYNHIEDFNIENSYSFQMTPEDLINFEKRHKKTNKKKKNKK